MRLGVFIAFLNDSYQRDLWRFLVAKARRSGIEVVGFCGHGLGAPIMAQSTMNLAYKMAGPRSLDGLVAFSNTLGTFHGPGAVAQLLEGRDLPTVSLGFDLEKVASVSARGGRALASVVRHLIQDHGRRHLALVSGPEGHLESQEREAAFFATLQAEGIDFDPALHFRGNFYTSAGREAAGMFLTSGHPFDAVVCLNDHMAIGLLEALREAGRRVPTEVSVVGFDDIEEAGWVSPPLTTVRQPLEALAAKALDLAVAQIRGQAAPSQVFSCEPVFRSSCGCPPQVPAVGPPADPGPDQARLTEALETGSPEAVLGTLAGALAGRWGESGALAGWRSRLLALRPGSDPGRTALVDHGLTWLAQEELRWEKEIHRGRQERSEEVRQHAVHLLGLLRLDAVVRYGEDHFPDLGVPRSFLVLFDTPGKVDDPEPPARARWLTTTLTADRRLTEVSFDTARLVPPVEGFVWGTLGWLVEPLVYQEEALGYLLFECAGDDDGVNYEILRETLSTAVKGAQLMEAVLGHQETLARQVQARTRQLREAHRDLQEVAHRTMQAIGQDIHDDLCQHLVGISMLATVAEETQRARGEVDPQSLREIRTLVDQAVVRSRQFAKTLYPPGLEERGLVSSLEDLIDSLGGPRGKISLTVEGDWQTLGADRGLQVYRIVQESLSNALRHSGSDVVLVRLVRSPEGYLAEVRDFGRGLPPGAIGSGMGTRILRARASSLGAQLNIYQLEPGVCVSCQIPPGDL